MCFNSIVGLDKCSIMALFSVQFYKRNRTTVAECLQTKTNKMADVSRTSFIASLHQIHKLARQTSPFIAHLRFSETKHWNVFRSELGKTNLKLLVMDRLQHPCVSECRNLWTQLQGRAGASQTSIQIQIMKQKAESEETTNSESEWNKSRVKVQKSAQETDRLGMIRCRDTEQYFALRACRSGP